VDLRTPEEPRYTETIQLDDEKDIVHAAGRYVEDHARCRLYGSRFDHLSLATFRVVLPVRDDTIEQMPGQFASFSG
jgi:hypothetical protein